MPSASQIAAAKIKAEGIINEHAVVVFSKSYCPYCRAAKKTLSDAGAAAFIVELDQIDDGEAIQDALKEITNQRTVPNIFIGHQHLGGNDSLQQSKSKGELATLLSKAGVQSA